MPVLITKLASTDGKRIMYGLSLRKGVFTCR